MPELPEVETIRRGLLPLLTGRKVVGVTVRDRRLRQPIRSRSLDRLRGATNHIADIHIEMTRGSTPLEFTFNFQWGGPGAR